MSALPKVKFYTPEQYLEMERAALDEKHEYLDGQIFLKSGGSPKHSTVCVNAIRELSNQLKGSPCQVFEANMKVGTSPSGLFSYPDISVVSDESTFHDNHQDVLTNPCVIIEVLSRSTEAFDRGRKFARYQRIKSFTDYVLIAQDEPRIEHYAKQSNGNWVLTVADGLRSKIHLANIGCTLKLAEVNDRIKFTETAPAKNSAACVKAQKMPKSKAKS